MFYVFCFSFNLLAVLIMVDVVSLDLLASFMFLSHYEHSSSYPSKQDSGAVHSLAPLLSLMHAAALLRTS